MRARRIGIALIALALSACATALPPAVRVADITILAGSYSGDMKETSEFKRSTRLIIQPDGRFELLASDPKGFRTLGRIALEPDGTLSYQFDGAGGVRGVIAKGTGVVYEGDGQRAIVLTQSDGSVTTTVRKSLP